MDAYQVGFFGLSFIRVTTFTVSMIHNGLYSSGPGSAVRVSVYPDNNLLVNYL